MAVTRSIEIRTEVPGPRSREIVERKEQVVAAPLSLVHPIVAAEARGALLTDVDGNTFVDLTGGVGCLNVGHSHPRVVAAAQEQLARFAHTDFTIVPYEVYVELAERLVARAPLAGPAKAGFFRARAASSRRPRSGSRASAASATTTGSCSSPTRCRPASRARAASSRWSTTR